MVKLKGKQYKIDFNKNKKLDKEDFKILQNKKRKIKMALTKSQRSLRLGVSKNGEPSQVNHHLKQVKDIYQKKL